MKLIFAVVHNDDGNKVVHKLVKEGHSVTKLSSSGGFLKTGNMTLMIGVEDANVDEIMAIIKELCQTRTQTVTPPVITGFASAYHTVDVTVGGATVFVCDVERFEKV